jgi:hypothetical protein
LFVAPPFTGDAPLRYSRSVLLKCTWCPPSYDLLLWCWTIDDGSVDDE